MAGTKQVIAWKIANIRKEVLWDEGLQYSTYMQNDSIKNANLVDIRNDVYKYRVNIPGIKIAKGTEFQKLLRELNTVCL